MDNTGALAPVTAAGLVVDGPMAAGPAEVSADALANGLAALATREPVDDLVTAEPGLRFVARGGATRIVLPFETG